MKIILVIISLTIFQSIGSSQTLELSTQLTDTELTWPWNWDIEVVGDKLLLTNEQGFLYTLEGNEWNKLSLDPGNNFLNARGVTVDDSGIIWISTTQEGLFSYDGTTITNYNVSNSGLPTNKLRDVISIGNKIWVSTDKGEGIFSFENNQVQHFTSDNSDLFTDYSNVFHTDELGNLYIVSSSIISKVSTTGIWTRYNVKDLFPWMTRLGIHVVSSSEIWLATSEGVAFFDGTNFTSYQEEYGEKRFSEIYKAKNGDLWLCELFEGIAVVRNSDIHFFKSNDFNFDVDGWLPSQVFKFVEFRDTIRMVGNIGNRITSASFSTSIDLDNDGFFGDDDCDDNNANVNPNQAEIPYNGFDDDCNSATLDDDLDQDGFLLADDCDDNNTNVNPNQAETPYNGIDDDCNSATLDDDLDQDGFLLAEDCDDNNENINPNAEEIPNNGIDEDCDGMDLTSTTQEIADGSYTFFPNPAKNTLKVVVNDLLNYRVSLLDMNGKLIMTLLNASEIPIDNIPQGTYLIELRDLVSGQKAVELIIIEN